MRVLKLLFLFFLLISAAKAQTQPAFWDDVQTIKKYDRLYAPPADPILFTGSSSIRLWTNLAEQFHGYTVLNRGIGGAVIRDIDRYVEDIIVPYHPKQIVLYVGENDIIAAPSGDSVFASFQRLFLHIRAKLPRVPIAYISIKPSPSREQFLPIAQRANQLIREYLQQQPMTGFIDIYPHMLDQQGKMRPELFRSDMLHMKPEGYAIWYREVKPFLVGKGE